MGSVGHPGGCCSGDASPVAVGYLPAWPSRSGSRRVGSPGGAGASLAPARLLPADGQWPAGAPLSSSHGSGPAVTGRFLAMMQSRGAQDCFLQSQRQPWDENAPTSWMAPAPPASSGKGFLARLPSVRLCLLGPCPCPAGREISWLPGCCRRGTYCGLLASPCPPPLHTLKGTVVSQAAGT